ncbi:pogo transposable element with ZNF domain isoform X2 [Engraulis encrasicolus]|uniref:pogo transposable element with ZNF domain isoform X2 n=1 Tax=Engraulis encrasicolus TaxID=184585 RepID=UPI002FD6B530
MIPQILQQLQVVSSSSQPILPTVGTTQPLVISQNIPVNAVAPNMQKAVGFILNGRTYLTGGQPFVTGAAQPFVTPKMYPPAQGPTVQVPVTITLTGPSGIQTVSAMATAGLSQFNQFSPAPLIATTTNNNNTAATNNNNTATTTPAPAPTPAVPAPTSTVSASGEGVPVPQPKPPATLPSPVVMKPSPQPSMPISTPMVPQPKPSAALPSPVVMKSSPQHSMSISTPMVPQPKPPAALPSPVVMKSSPQHSTTISMPIVTTGTYAPIKIAPAPVSPVTIAPAPIAPPTFAPAPVAPSVKVAQVRVVPASRPLPPPPPPPLSPPPPSTSTFQLRAPASRSKASQSCKRCGSPYKMIASLRGYMCMCNKLLLKAIQATEPKKKKPKRPKNPEELLGSGGGSLKSPKKPPPVVPPSFTSSSRYAKPPRRGGSSDDEESDDDDEEEEQQKQKPPRRRRPKNSQAHMVEGEGGVDETGKLIILVEDFYYGVYRGANSEKRTPDNAITFKCHLCDKRLKNNLKMMVHTKHHVEMDQQYEAETQTTCQHCFRSFSSPLSLQYHVESVHSQAESSTKCRICELAYENEPVFLQHMKSTHKPGEMPYICQVCGFRSSFYLDVIFHFRDLHSNTTNLLCPYCLKVFRCSSSYQLHYSRHQKKSVLHCDKCRLQFLFTKEKSDHKQAHHITHRTPKQLEGLKPGTRVTIRTYAALPPGPSSAPVQRVVDTMSMPPPALEPIYPDRQPTPTRSVTPISPGPLSPKHVSPRLATPNREEAYNSTVSPTPTAAAPTMPTTTMPMPMPMAMPLPTRKIPSVSQQEIMAKFEKQRSPLETASCVECTFEIPNYVQHYPTYVHCNLCRYSTCCSRSYANHMINNHVPRKTGQFSKYLSMFRRCQKGVMMYCLSCEFSTDLGDTMANHLVENPEHEGSSPRSAAGFPGGYKRFLYVPSKAFGKTQSGSSSSSMVSPKTSSTPVARAAPDMTPSAATLQLEKLFSSSSLPIKTEKMTPKKVLLNGSESTTTTAGGARTEGACLSSKQLKTVLYALCCGIPQAAARFQTAPALIQAWLLDRKSQGPSKGGRRGLGPRAADKLAEWVLAQREQQLAVDEDTLFAKAKECVGGTDPGLGQDWAVDFLLQHELGVQPVGTEGARMLPQSVQDGVRSFARFIKKQVGTGAGGFGESNVGAVDEVAVFIDLQQLGRIATLPSAFHLTELGTPLMDVVLSAMADGTLLPAMVFLKGTPPACTAAVPASVFLEAKPEGFSDEERLNLWLSKVWRPYINPSGGGKGLLVMDPYRGHLADDFLAALNSANTLPAVVPKACSCCLQPLEACSGPVLREFLQACWSQQVSSAPESLVGAQPDELALLLIGWLAELLQVLGARPDLLQRSFKTVMEPPAVEEGAAAWDGQDVATKGLVQELTTALLQSNPLETDGHRDDGMEEDD